MSFNVIVSDSANSDLNVIIGGIADIIGDSEMALRIYKQLTGAINALGDMPSRYPLCRDEYWSNKGLRIMNSTPYKVYYLVNNDENRVEVLNVLHQRQDDSNVFRVK